MTNPETIGSYIINSCHYCDEEAIYETMHTGIYICEDCIEEYARAECIQEIDYET